MIFKRGPLYQLEPKRDSKLNAPGGAYEKHAVVFTQKISQLFSFYGSCQSASPVSSTFAMVGTLWATSWPLIGSSGGSNSIDCQSTGVDCLQCFDNLNHTSFLLRGGRKTVVVPALSFINARDHVFHSLSRCSLAQGHKSAAHTALINGLGGQLSIPVPSHIFPVSP